MIYRILTIVFPVFAVIGAGWLYGRWRKPDMTAVNVMTMDVFTPALIFVFLAGQRYSLAEFGPLALGCLLVMFLAGALGLPLLRVFKAQGKTLIPPLMFKNIGNMGLPLYYLTFGVEGMPAVIVLMLIENFLHFSFGIWLLDKRVRLLSLWRVPVLLAGIAGFAVSASGLEIWPPLNLSFRMIADICVPLMLFALGVRLTEANLSSMKSGLLGAVLSPVLGMAAAALICPLFDLPRQQQDMLFLFGALPPAVLNYMFAERYRQEPDKVAAIVLAGNVAALFFVPLALWLRLN